MDKAKAAVSDFMNKSGHHDTTVHETVAPAVVQENVSQHRHEEATTAIDREIHQDHYHTSVQPVKDREVMAEKHSHNMAAVQERVHDHGDDAAVQARLEQERAQFKNTTTQGATRETSSTAPTIAGEHVHHHVHETIQPVVQKETIQPSVVHTTIPIHEVHNNEAKHHSASALPAVSMADFKKQGGTLGGREERYDGFEGEPRAVGSALGGSSGTSGTTGTTGTGVTGTGHHGHHHGSTTTTGPHSSNLENKMDPRVDSNYGTSGQTRGTGTGSGYGTGTGVGSTGVGSNYGSSTTGTGTSTGTGLGSHTGTHGSTGTGYGGSDLTGTTSGTSGTTTTKPSMLDRMNPMKDSDGDGKKGFMK